MKVLKKFNIELAMGFCASLVVEANSLDEAIEKAKEIVGKNPSKYLEDAEFVDVNFGCEQ